MKLRELCDKLEEWAPLAYQESYDNSGLIVGDLEQAVTAVLVSLDCLESVVDEAIQRDCNVIVSHHPIVFKGLKNMRRYFKGGGHIILEIYCKMYYRNSTGLDW